MTRNYVFSTREKIMIVALSIILVVVGVVYFLIMPAQAKQKSVSEDLDFMMMEQMRMKTQISAIPNLRTNIDAMRLTLDGSRDKYTDFHQTEDLESEFTRFLLKNGSTPMSVLLTYDGGPAKITDELYKYTLNITAAGYLNDLLNLADYINAIYSYRLTKMSIFDSGDGTQASYTVETVMMRPGS